MYRHRDKNVLKVVHLEYESDPGPVSHTLLLTCRFKLGNMFLFITYSCIVFELTRTVLDCVSRANAVMRTSVVRS